MLNLIGIVILVAGLGSVALIERNARRYEASRVEDTEATHALLYPEDSRQYVRAAEEMNGKFVMIIEGWWQSAENLGHSRAFAVTVAVVSLLAASCAFSKSTFSPRK